MSGMWRASTGKACRLACVLGTLAAQSVQGLEPAEVVRHSCAQPGPDRVECEYRLSIPGRVPTVTAKVADLALPPPLHLPYPYDQSITALLIVIDIGALERPDGGSRIPAHIERILSVVKPHHRVGVATFEAQPRVSLPLGAGAEDIVTAVQTLAREPSPVALSQDAMAAVRSLAVSPAARKAILFFGDESANPDAYYHEKLIAAARDAQVVVFGVVYPSTDPMAPALEALGQLAKESGGDLVIARPPDYELPEAFATDPFAAIDSGGRLSIDLTPAIGARLTGPQTLTLNVAAGDQALAIEVPVTIGPPTPPPPKAKAGAAIVAQSGMPPWIWLSALAAAFLALSAILFLRTQRRGMADSPKTGPPAARAYVTRSDGDAGRLLVATTPWRIGRGKDNELVLRDNSVSRHHAEIVRDDSGHFAIKDLDSLNGVFVDNKKVQWTALSDGAQIDIGDLRLTFSTDGGSPPPDPEREGGAPTETRTSA
ncbi:MAG: FHA domain-containing protein [Gammaproteobacteria bacterium]